mmetsp:Transcript_975/g.1144  ORF Transcript_975/g.1144 Transcript_975/m.1144 type:complete len:218 (+) Transcript_975:66-719(+)
MISRVRVSSIRQGIIASLSRHRFTIQPVLLSVKKFRLNYLSKHQRNQYFLEYCRILKAAAFYVFVYFINYFIQFCFHFCVHYFIHYFIGHLFFNRWRCRCHSLWCRSNYFDACSHNRSFNDLTTRAVISSSNITSKDFLTYISLNDCISKSSCISDKNSIRSVTSAVWVNICVMTCICRPIKFEYVPNRKFIRKFSWVIGVRDNPIDIDRFTVYKIQ